MRAVDTNALVRLITRDDPRQVASAEAFVAGGAWVSHVVLVETVWVLTAVYELGAASIATAVQMLLNHQHLTLQDADVVAAALARYRTRPGIALSDCLVLEIARKAGHVPLGTFDRQLARLDGAQKMRIAPTTSSPSRRVTGRCSSADTGQHLVEDLVD